MPSYTSLEIALRQEYIKDYENFHGKLNQINKKSKYVFKPGDIIKYILMPSVNSKFPEEGLVLRVKNLSLPHKEDDPIRQIVTVVFPSEGEYLRKKVRRLIKKIFFNQNLGQEVNTFDNNKLEYVKDCPRSWIQPISTQEIHTHRFSDLLDEED